MALDLGIKREFFVKCECGTEGLHIEKDTHDGDVYFSLWYFNSFSLSWRNKLHWIWHILNSRPYHDTIVIAPERIPQVIEILEGLKK